MDFVSVQISKFTSRNFVFRIVPGSDDLLKDVIRWEISLILLHIVEKSKNGM